MMAGGTPIGATPIGVACAGTTAAGVVVTGGTSGGTARLDMGAEVKPTPRNSSARMATGIFEVILRRPEDTATKSLWKRLFTDCEICAPSGMLIVRFEISTPKALVSEKFTVAVFGDAFTITRTVP